jgi:hypothetical protein
MPRKKDKVEINLQIKVNLLLNIIKTEKPIMKQVLVSEYAKQLDGFTNLRHVGNLTKEYLNDLVQGKLLIVKDQECKLTPEAIALDPFPQNIPIYV